MIKIKDKIDKLKNVGETKYMFADGSGSPFDIKDLILEIAQDIDALLNENGILTDIDKKQQKDIDDLIKRVEKLEGAK